MSDPEKPLREATCKPLYQPWRQEEFRSDLRVMMMSAIQRWMYRTVLQEAFVCSSRPHLPDDDGQLWLMAGCENQKVWDKNKAVVRSMFMEIEDDGVKLLKHKRLSDDWDRLLAKRKVRQEAGKRGGQISKPKQLLSKTQAEPKQNEAREVKEKLEEEREVEVEEIPEPGELNFPENGQGEDELKAKKVIPELCSQLLGVKGEIFPDVLKRVESRAILTSNGQVIREFEEWAVENRGDDFRGRPITKWLDSLDNPYLAEQKKAVSDPKITNLIYELAYLSDNLITFENKAKAALAEEIESGRATPEEVIAVFKADFFPQIKDDDFNLKRGGTLFVQKVGQLVYTYRRKKAEKATEAEAVARTAADMVARAEQERLTRAEARQKEQELVEDELGD